MTLTAAPQRMQPRSHDLAAERGQRLCVAVPAGEFTPRAGPIRFTTNWKYEKGNCHDKDPARLSDPNGFFERDLRAHFSKL